KPGNYPAGDGLYLRVSATGAASWAYRYQIDGKRRMMGLGSVKGLSLAQARAKAIQAQAEAKQGIDPLQVREAEKGREAAEGMTFRKLADDFIKKRSGSWRNAKHGQQWVNTLATY